MHTLRRSQASGDTHASLDSMSRSTRTSGQHSPGGCVRAMAESLRLAAHPRVTFQGTPRGIVRRHATKDIENPGSWLRPGPDRNGLVPFANMHRRRLKRGATCEFVQRPEFSSGAASSAPRSAVRISRRLHRASVRRRLGLRPRQHHSRPQCRPRDSATAPPAWST